MVVAANIARSAMSGGTILEISLVTRAPGNGQAPATAAAVAEDSTHTAT
jgi:hypothetical protein